MLAARVYVFQVCTNWPIFTKFDMNIMQQIQRDKICNPVISTSEKQNNNNNNNNNNANYSANMQHIYSCN
jgi:hypothetical protein